MAGLAICAMLGGCATPPPGGTLSGAPDRVTPRPAFPSSPATAPTPETPAESGVRLDRRVYGTVVSANAALRFVVMDFAVWHMPAMEQRLHVYRNEQRVGEIKVTGPTVDTTVAGDLTAGEARPGDEVRE